MDRFYRGFAGGIAGGVVMNIWSLASYYFLRLADRRFLDWSSVLMYGHLPRTLGETLLALAAQLAWAGFLGIVFSYFILGISSRGFLFKGAFWGFIMAFILYAVAIIVRMPYFNTVTLGTAVSQLFGGMLWGMVLALVLNYLNEKVQ